MCQDKAVTIYATAVESQVFAAVSPSLNLCSLLIDAVRYGVEQAADLLLRIRQYAYYEWAVRQLKLTWVAHHH